MTLGALFLTVLQLHWATVAYQIGAPYGEGRTLVALEGQESSYCRFKVNGWSRGCLGIKRSTARREGGDPTVTRKQLTEDNNRNLLVGLKILLYCSVRTKSWRQSLLCYHYGEPVEKLMVQGSVPYDPDGYVKAIQRRMKEIRVSND